MVFPRAASVKAGIPLGELRSVERTLCFAPGASMAPVSSRAVQASGQVVLVWPALAAPERPIASFRGGWPAGGRLPRRPRLARGGRVLAAATAWTLALLAGSVFLLASSLGQEAEPERGEEYSDERTRAVAVAVFAGCVVSNLGVMLWAYTRGVAEGRISTANCTISDLALDPLTGAVLCVVFGGVSVCMLLLLQSWWVLGVLVFMVGVILVTFERSPLLHFVLAVLAFVCIAGACVELLSALGLVGQVVCAVGLGLSLSAICFGHWRGLAWLLGGGEVGLISTLSGTAAAAKLLPLVARWGD
jgi:hypothetical protein